MMWREADEFYRGIVGKLMNGKTKPSKMDDGFYHCSTTSQPSKQSDLHIKSMEKQSWHSTFQLVKDKFNYARVFVGYGDLDDPSEYTIYIKHVKVKNTSENRAVLLKHGK